MLVRDSYYAYGFNQLNKFYHTISYDAQYYNILDWIAAVINNDDLAL